MRAYIIAQPHTSTLRSNMAAHAMRDACRVSRDAA